MTFKIISSSESSFSFFCSKRNVLKKRKSWNKIKKMLGFYGVSLVRCIGRGNDSWPVPMVVACHRFWSIFHLIIPGSINFSSFFENEPENIERICCLVCEVSACLYASTKASTSSVSHVFSWGGHWLYIVGKFPFLKYLPIFSFLARCNNSSSSCDNLSHLFEIVGLLPVGNILPCLKWESIKPDSIFHLAFDAMRY